MIREAEAADRDALEAFLLAHIDVAMFPMANLRNHGLRAGDFSVEHPNVARFWVLGQQVDGAIAVTRRGMILAVLPQGGDFGPLARVLAGVTISGAVGEAVATRQVLAALRLAGRPMRRDVDEPGFALDLAELLVPPIGDASLLAAGVALRETLLDWRRAYHVEILGTPLDEAAALAFADVAGYIAAGSHRVLQVAGVPVAMTGFNAQLPEIVQIGGVYVPPDLRRRGYARLAVALHLAEARANGVARAVLFAASDAAARAYRAIGFQPARAMALVLFAAPWRVAP